MIKLSPTLLGIFLLFILASCDQDESSKILSEGNSTEKIPIALSNSTGTSSSCEEEKSLSFELRSFREAKQVTVEPQLSEVLFLDIKEGEPLNIKLFNAQDYVTLDEVNVVIKTPKNQRELDDEVRTISYCNSEGVILLNF
ncbi:MAG: hypothetical protein AAF694_28195 [Bacteroidota bacterium]